VSGYRAMLTAGASGERGFAMCESLQTHSEGGKTSEVQLVSRHGLMRHGGDEPTAEPRMPGRWAGLRHVPKAVVRGVVGATDGHYSRGSTVLRQSGGWPDGG
jgi:hypothetical protein